MLTTWVGNGQTIAQVYSVTVTAVPPAGGGVLSASCNGKVISYTTLSSDTPATAAAAWQALLGNQQTAPPEFNEAAWTVSSTVVQATAQVPGTPFTVTFTASNGASLVAGIATPNSSQSDVLNPANWSRGGFPMLPQAGDDVVLANSAVPLLWNLDGLKNIAFASFTRWQSFTGTVGLPENNPNGYVEYRPAYFQFSGPPGGLLNVTLGQGTTGGGPGRERYNVGQQATFLNVLGSGSALDDFAIRFLGGNGGNTLRIVGASVGVAMLPGEQAALAQATVDGGGSLSLGPNVLYGQSLSLVPSGSASPSPKPSASASPSPAQAGQVSAIGASVTLFSAPAQLTLQAGAQGTVMAVNGNFPSVQALGGSSLTWNSNSNIGALVLTAGSQLDKSGDVQPMQIGSVTLDADTCQILDPNNAITFTGPIVYNNAVQSGPIQLGTGRSVRIT